MAKRPNILLIVMDCVRADHFSCYGYHRPTTPNIDRVADQGVRFATAIAPAAWTVPTIASMFTGTYPPTHNAVNGHAYLDNRLYTLAELLGALGYRTIGFGNNGWVSHSAGMSRGFHIFKENFRWPGRKMTHLAMRLFYKAFLLTRGVKFKGAYDTNRAIRSWLKHHHDDSAPFFLFVHYNEAHAPYRPPARYARRFLNNVSWTEARKVNQDHAAYHSGYAPMGSREFKILRALYDGEIAYLDGQMQMIFQALTDLDIIDETVLIITADHGDNQGEHNLMDHKYCLYDTLIHVPLIIRYPPLLPTGLVINQTVQTVDIFPTIMDILNVERADLARQFQGYSLLPEKLPHRPAQFAVAERRNFSPRLGETFAKYPDFDYTVYERDQTAIRTMTHKYIWASDGRDELYEIAVDPGEKHNMIADHPEQVRALRKMLSEHLERVSADGLPEPVVDGMPEMDEQIIEHLRDLGYIA
jgi:arylsulfatase A-like enzyme